MNAEQKGGDSPQEPQVPNKPRAEVDVYRANQELERWLFGGQSLDSVRDGSATLSPPPSGRQARGKLISTIVYSPDRRTITHIGSDGQEYPEGKEEPESPQPEK